MKARDLFENDYHSMLNMVLQGIRNLKLDIKEVSVVHQKAPGSIRKDCFNNSFRYWSNHSGCTYVLGYLFYAGIPIEHAWVRDGERYLDVTLDPKKQETYFAVYEVSDDVLMRYVDAHHSAPSLFDLNRFEHSSK